VGHAFSKEKLIIKQFSVSLRVPLVSVIVHYLLISDRGGDPIPAA